MKPIYMRLIFILFLFTFLTFRCLGQDIALIDGQGCIRTKPSYSGTTVEFLESGDTITIVQYEGNNFYKIEYKSGKKRKLGYIASHFLKFPTSSEDSLEESVTQSTNSGGEVQKTKMVYTSPTRTMHTGPRGGRYYINSKGKKTYVKH
jgi:hypothetical protein